MNSLYPVSCLSSGRLPILPTKTFETNYTGPPLGQRGLNRPDRCHAFCCTETHIVLVIDPLGAVCLLFGRHNGGFQIKQNFSQTTQREKTKYSVCWQVVNDWEAAEDFMRCMQANQTAPHKHAITLLSKHCVGAGDSSSPEGDSRLGGPSSPPTRIQIMKERVQRTHSNA